MVQLSDMLHLVRIEVFPHDYSLGTRGQNNRSASKPQAESA